MRVSLEGYEVFKATATDIEPQRIAATVALRLQGSAKIVVREMDPAILANGAVGAHPQAGAQGQPAMIQINGLQFLLRQLRRRYAPLDQEVQINSYSTFAGTVMRVQTRS